MTLFLVLAAALAVAAVAWLAFPLLKAAPAAEGEAAASPRDRWTAVGAVAVLVPLVAIASYVKSSNYDWDFAAAQGGSTGDQLRALQDYTTANPSDVEGWMRLGQAYGMLGRHRESADALRTAQTLTGGRAPVVGLAYAEALANSDPDTLRGEAAPLIESALAVMPENPTALWLGGLVALGQGKPELARTRWQSLLALNPPPDVAQILTERIAQVEQAAGLAPSSGAPAPAAGGAAPAAGTAVATVRVELSPALAAGIPASAPLFLLARDPTQPGPPFAAQRRTVGELPLEAQLSDADAMMPGRTLSMAKQVIIVARISKSGQPMAGSGDLYGEAAWTPGSQAPLKIVIDRTVP